MSRTIVTRRIEAPVDRVFETVADIGNFSKAISRIVNVEFMSEQRLGVGTRFKETRLMNGREAVVELEVTEFVRDDHVRLVSDTHGTVWDTVFRVSDVGGATELVMTMDANAYRLLPKLMNPLIKGMIKKAIETDMDSVKTFCETAGS